MIPERRILVYVVAMITGIILVMRYDAASQLLVSARSHQTLAQNTPFQYAAYFEGLTATTIALAVIVLVTFAFVLKAGMSIIWRSARSGSSGSSAGWWRDIGLTVLLAGFWFVAGIVAAMVQLAQMPKVWQGDGTGLSVSGTVEQVDGRSNARLRLWVRVDKTPVAGSAPRPAAVAGYLARLSLDAPEAVMTTPEGIRNVLPGDRLQLAVRIYPSPPAVFYGAQDHARQARARDVVASGYLTRPPQYLGTGDGWPHRLARYRQARADTIAEGMSAPQGGIAAALLIGDRRHVDDSTYDMFRFSGLAHLLAISGLHMGLLCFGVIGFLRGVMALMPCVNSLLSLAFRCVTAWVVCSSSSRR